jgi:hypothetical protein
MKTCSVMRRKPCVQEVPKGIEVKPKLVEAQSPAVKRHARRSMSETATPNNARYFEACKRKVSSLSADQKPSSVSDPQ